MHFFTDAPFLFLIFVVFLHFYSSFFSMGFNLPCFILLHFEFHNYQEKIFARRGATSAIHAKCLHKLYIYLYIYLVGLYISVVM